MDKDYIYQAPIREWIENDWGKEIFVHYMGAKKIKIGTFFFRAILFP